MYLTRHYINDTTVNLLRTYHCNEHTMMSQGSHVNKDSFVLLCVS